LRTEGIGATIGRTVESAKAGKMIVQGCIGGYMYLRSMIGPEGLLYMFYDDPGLIHDCMETWFKLADAVTARHQKYVTFDELFLAEDICYNHGSLISPEMVREFLFPYYQQLITNVKSRQLDRNRHLFIKIDTDGFAPAVIPLYQGIGMDAMLPFEVASGCDVVAVGRQYPDLVISGGIDKRVLAQGRGTIDRYLDSILPAMHRRGGYIPTCDHGVPEEVSLENYFHYRKRCMEYA
jgi:uroporphyrinogen decarboxylase